MECDDDFNLGMYYDWLLHKIWHKFITFYRFVVVAFSSTAVTVDFMMILC